MLGQLSIEPAWALLLPEDRLLPLSVQRRRMQKDGISAKPAPQRRPLPAAVRQEHFQRCLAGICYGAALLDPALLLIR